MTFLGVPCLASSRIAPCLSRPIISLSRGMFCWRVSATSMKLSMAPSLAQDQGGKIRIPQRGIFTVLLTPAAGANGEKEAGLSLITHVAVEPAHTSDANALIPAIEDAKERGLGPTEVLADSLYGSEKNVAAAAAMGTEVVAPVPGGGKKRKSARLSEFALTDEGGIANCPMGHAPIEDAARGNHRDVVFAVEYCFGCPRRKECPVKSVRKGYGFSYDRKQVRMAKRRAREKTEPFRDRYRFRAGIEATFSALDRLTGVKHLRVRGMPAVRFAVVLKALGLNLLRAAAARRPENGEGTAPSPANPRILDGIVSVHAQFM